MSKDDGLRRRILVADDDRAILELLCTRLTLAGYDAFGARDYLAKPFRDSNLMMRTARLFRPCVRATSLEDSFAEMDRMLTVRTAAAR